ncbi:MATE efflux family protein [Pholiota conissans]|uniref:MATE efflux family protein n=1 Tax=Pholiota conissans TaxID=109636 RepID=A0A9P5YZN2_9AGAR|nr:MATE efflux family protein [Pholiota conissans]
MSSTYAHYQGPSSVPSDGIIASRANAHHNDDIHDMNSNDDATLRIPGRPTKLTIGTYSSRDELPSNNFKLPTESTLLLNDPAIPPIEDSDDCDPASENESKVVMFWEELRVLTKFALPVFGTQVLEYSLVVASVITIGHISTKALAAISLGSMTASVSGFSIIQGFGSALDTMLPSAWTSSQPQLVGLWAQRMTVVMFMTLIPMLFIWLNAESLLILLKQDPEVAHLAAVYLRWVSLGLPAYAFNCISRRYFQSQGLFAVPTRIIFIVAPINALVNYLLVWGPEPIRLGFIGAPIATAISFNLISLLSILYGIFYAPRTAWHPLSRRMFTSLGILINLGLSGVGQTASEWWAWELVALAAALLGPTALATQSVLLTSCSTTFQAPFALSLAVAVRIGNLLGESRARRAEVAAKTSILMVFIIESIPSTVFLVFRKKWAYIFNDDPEVVKLVASLMPMCALFQVFDGTAGVTGGILRARGKQFIGALLNLTGYYVLGIPLGIYLAFGKKMGLFGLWLGLTFSLVYCAVFTTWIALKTDWNFEVQKVAQRIKDEDKLRATEERERAERDGYA